MKNSEGNGILDVIDLHSDGGERFNVLSIGEETLFIFPRKEPRNSFTGGRFHGSTSCQRSQPIPTARPEPQRSPTLPLLDLGNQFATNVYNMDQYVKQLQLRSK